MKFNIQTIIKVPKASSHSHNDLNELNVLIGLWLQELQSKKISKCMKYKQEDNSMTDN